VWDVGGDGGLDGGALVDAAGDGRDVRAGQRPHRRAVVGDRDRERGRPDGGHGTGLRPVTRRYLNWNVALWNGPSVSFSVSCRQLPLHDFSVFHTRV
jgi:hypothetical protein